MSTVCRIPVGVRVLGRPTDDDLERLTGAVARAVAARVAAGERELAELRPGTGDRQWGVGLREPFDPRREAPTGEGYELPSYDERGRLRVVRFKRQPPKKLRAAVLARARIRVPTRNVLWLLQDDNGEPMLWVKRLTTPIEEIVPEVEVTFDLYRVRDPSRDFADLTFVFERFIESTRHNVFFIGRWRLAKDYREFERRLGVPLGDLFRRGGVHLPWEMTADERTRTVLFAYVTFPGWIERYMVSEDVVAAEQAFEEALKRDPIGPFDDVVKNSAKYKDKLIGGDDDLVVVTVGEQDAQEKRVVSLKMLREAIKNVEAARASPLYFGYFKHTPPPAVSGRHTAKHIDWAYVSGFDVSPAKGGRVSVGLMTYWAFMAHHEFILDYQETGIEDPKASTRDFAEDELVALRVGGSRFDQAAPLDKEIELLVPASMLGELLVQIQDRMLKGQMIMGAFRELEHFTEALMIYGAIGTAGQLSTAGGAGLGILRTQGLRAGAATIGRALLTREAAVLGGEAALNLVLPAVTALVNANRDQLSKTTWGRAVVKSVDFVNLALAVYGLGRLALGGARLLRARLRTVPPAEIEAGVEQSLKELDELVKKLEQATANESKALLAKAVGDEGKALAGLQDGARDAAQAATELQPDLMRRTIQAETEGGFKRYMDALLAKLESAGMTSSQLKELETALVALNKARRAALVPLLAPKLAQERLAELGQTADLGDSARTMLAELRARQAAMLKAGKQGAANALGRRIASLERWAQGSGVLKNESDALVRQVTASNLLTKIAEEGGVPMLRRLWMQFRAPRGRPLQVSFEEYVGILLRHYRGAYGEYQVAFRLGERYILVKAPDSLVTIPGTDIVAIPRGGGDTFLIDNKALSAKQVDAVDALTRNLPQNVERDLTELTKLAGESKLPGEFDVTIKRLQAARDEIAPLVKGMSKDRIASEAVQRQIQAILAKNHIRRVVTNAGGSVAGLSSELEALGIELQKLNL